MRYDDPQRVRNEHGTRLQANGTSPLPVITLLEPGEAPGSWLACIHAHRGGNRFGYHTATLGDLQAFTLEWLEDPEACLARHFQYFGPEEPAHAGPPLRRVNAPSLSQDDFWGEVGTGVEGN